jgi:hypothetical protein
VYPCSRVWSDHEAHAAVLSRLRDVHPRERRRVADVVRRVAVRHLPLQLTLVEIDRREHAVRRLYDRQTLDLQTATTTARAAASGARRPGRARASSCRASATSAAAAAASSSSRFRRRAAARASAALGRIGRAAEARTFRDAEVRAVHA